MCAWGGRGRGGLNGGGYRGNRNGNGQPPPENGNGNLSPDVPPVVVAAPTPKGNPWNRPAQAQTLGKGDNNGNFPVESGTPPTTPMGATEGSLATGMAGMKLRHSSANSDNDYDGSNTTHDGEGRRGRRPRTPFIERFAKRADFVNTRDNVSTNTKVGTAGAPVDLQANHFRLTRKPDWCFFHHHVDYVPEPGNTRLKKSLLEGQKAKLGGSGYVTDGHSIWTAHRLTPKKEETLVLTSRSGGPGGQIVEIRIKMAGEGEVDAGDPRRLQLFNVILRSCLGAGGLGLVLNRRNYFDPAQAVQAPRRLTVWPGYVTTLRQFDSDILLEVGIKHKIIRSETCLDTIQGHGAPRGPPSRQQTAELIVGAIVMTKYNNRTYKIEDIDWGKTPMSTFPMRDGSSTTYVAYYESRHGVQIKEPNRQPLLMAKLKKKDFHRGKGAAGGGGGEMEIIYLVPELCFHTGITEQEWSDFNFMKGLNTVIMQNPSQKMASTRAFMERLSSHVGVTAILGSWGLAFDKRPVNIKGRQLPQQAVLMAPPPGATATNGNTKLNYNGSDWTSAIVGGRRMDESRGLSRWVIICPAQQEGACVPKLLRHMMEVGRGLGFSVQEPLAKIPVAGQRAPDFQKAIQGALGRFGGAGRLDLILIILPNDKKELYALVKRECCLAGVASQCVQGRTIGKEDFKFKSVATKIVIQINAKLGGVPWKLEATFKTPTMLVGFDVYHCGKGAGRSVGAMVATHNRFLSKYYSTVTWQERGQELSTTMSGDIEKCLAAFARNNNGILPHSIFFFRDGVGEGQLHYVVDTELKAIQDSLARIYDERNKDRPKLTMVVVTKRINARLFRPQGAPGQYVDAAPGTVVDTVITKPERYDFLLTSVRAPPSGTASPTSYNVIWDDNKMSPDEIQALAYRQCHGYFNWSGTVSVPAVCQYAHKLAFLTGTADLKPEHVEQLSNTLYYL